MKQFKSAEQFILQNGFNFQASLMINLPQPEQAKVFSYLRDFVFLSSVNGYFAAISLLDSVESPETEFGSRMGNEYKLSSINDGDCALLLCDDGSWINARHTNGEVKSLFLSIDKLRKSIQSLDFYYSKKYGKNL